MIKTNEIYNENCLGDNGMKLIPDKSVDAIIADLPYGTTKNKWDTILDPKALFKEYWRILKPNGVIILFGQDKFTSTMTLADKNHRYNLIWDKVLPSGHLNANRMPMRSHEDIMVFSDSEISLPFEVDSAHEDVMVFYRKLPDYTPQKVDGGKMSHSRGNRLGEVADGNKNYGEYKIVDNREELGTLKHPVSILKFQKPHPSVAKHPTEKPVPLLEWLIKAYTKEGAVIVDNTAGGGSLPEACIRTNRHFVAFEWKEDNPTEYFDVAVERIGKLCSELEVSLANDELATK